MTSRERGQALDAVLRCLARRGGGGAGPVRL